MSERLYCPHCDQRRYPAKGTTRTCSHCLAPLVGAPERTPSPVDACAMPGCGKRAMHNSDCGPVDAPVWACCDAPSSGPHRLYCSVDAPSRSEPSRKPWSRERMDRDWTEDFEHENGRYIGTCTTCGEMFEGHKRRVVCKLCAPPPSDGDEGDDLDDLAAELSEIARRLDYRPARMKRIRSRLVDWLAERDRDHADALYAAYSMGAARARSAPHPDPEGLRERIIGELVSFRSTMMEAECGAEREAAAVVADRILRALSPPLSEKP